MNAPVLIVKLALVDVLDNIRALGAMLVVSVWSKAVPFRSRSQLPVVPVMLLRFPDGTALKVAACTYEPETIRAKVP